MKNLQNLKGVKALNKKEQQSINGGNPLQNCFGETQCLSHCGPYGTCHELIGTGCYFCFGVQHK